MPENYLLVFLTFTTEGRRRTPIDDEKLTWSLARWAKRWYRVNVNETMTKQYAHFKVCCLILWKLFLECSQLSWFSQNFLLVNRYFFKQAKKKNMLMVSRPAFIWALTSRSWGQIKHVSEQCCKFNIRAHILDTSKVAMGLYMYNCVSTCSCLQLLYCADYPQGHVDKQRMLLSIQ